MKNIVRLGIGISVIFIVLVSTTQAFSSRKEKIGSIISEIESKYPVKLSYKNIPKATWKEIKYTTASKSDYNRLFKYLKLFQEEFNKYPKEFIKKTKLKRVVFVKNLSCAGQFRAAVPDYYKEILFYDFAYGPCNTIYHRHVIHHEFYHMIEEQFNGNPRWKDPKWAKFNDKNFKYGKGGATVYGKPGMYPLTHPQKGFTGLYSMSTLQEDKAEIYASLFIESENRKIAKWIEEDDILKKKVNYMKTFLFNVCKDMDAEYWKELSKKSVMHSISGVSNGRNASRMRIVQGENGDFYYEDGTKVPDDIVSQIKNSIRKGKSSGGSKKGKREIRSNKTTEITKDEIFNKKHYSLSDFYQLGVISFYKEAKERGFMKAVEKMRNSTAMLRRTKSNYKIGSPNPVGMCTAVFLSKGYLLTAGHCISGIKEGKFTNVSIVTVDGNKLKAEVVGWSFNRASRSVDDWAVLKLLESYKGPTASIGVCERDDEIIVMGYPRHLAHDENYEVHQVLFFYGNENKAYPIPFMGKIIRDGEITLTIGSDILGGCSGGPIFNLKGEVVGVLSSSKYGFSNTTIRFSPSEEILKKCPELAKALESSFM